MKTTKILLTVAACSAMAGSSWAAEVYLRAAPTTITLPGRIEPVTMWGFAQDSNATANDGTVTVPGPQITIAPGDTTLTIHLKNYLPEPVSIVIPGQNGATLGDPATFTPTGDVRVRASSFTHQAGAVGGSTPGTTDFVWTNVQPGTYLYFSGSHSAVQVQMGLYGALVKDYSAAVAYQGVNYDNGVTLLFSEVDVRVHDAVAAGTYGQDDIDNPPLEWSVSPFTVGPEDIDYNDNGKFDSYAMHSTTDSKAQYFLINGKPYTPGRAPIYLKGGQGEKALLRFLNAGLDSHTPVLNGIYVQLVAEDGKKYANRKSVYAIDLPSLKTTDALVNNMNYGSYALYDRRLGLANGPGSSGGMLAYVTVPFMEASSGSIKIPNNGTSGNAGPFGSGVAQFIVPGGNGFTVGKVTVTLHDFYHGRPQDVDMMLVHVPSATKVMLVSDAGGETAVPSTAPVTLTIDDDAASALSENALVSGTYQPSNVSDGQGTDAFSGGGIPSGPVQSTLSAFNGVNSAGQWRLYIRDDSSGTGTVGALAGGWTMMLYPAWQP